MHFWKKVRDPNPKNPRDFHTNQKMPKNKNILKNRNNRKNTATPLSENVKGLTHLQFWLCGVRFSNTRFHF